LSRSKFIDRSPDQASRKAAENIQRPYLLVAGTRFEADLMHIPVITAHWRYVPAKQGARKMVRT